MEDINVSIVTHRTPPAELARACESVLRCERIKTIYIIDNSPDETISEAAALIPKSKYIHVPNRGFGAGHNTAIQLAATNIQYHLVLNADVWWNGDVIGSIARYMDQNSDVAQVMPRTIYPDGALQLTARRLPTPMDMIAKRFLPKLFRRRIDNYLLADADHSLKFNCPYLLGSFMMLRMKALRAEGAFDERFFMYPEDIDLTRRLHRHWLTVYYPDVEIVHAHAAASRKNLRMLLIHIVNMARYFNKWGWFSDPERDLFNRNLNSNITPLKGPRPNQRG